jgi:hypothetical protein
MYSTTDILLCWFILFFDKALKARELGYILNQFSFASVSMPAILSREVLNKLK